MSLTLECKPRSKELNPRALRRAGWTPATIYGHKGNESDLVMIDAPQLKHILLHATPNNTLISIKVEGSDFSGNTIIKEVQRHPYKKEVYHVSFFAVDQKAKVEVIVPLVFTGTPAGVKAGGSIQLLMKTIKVVCPPDRVPEKFEVDISHLEVRQGIRVGDLPLPEGLTIASEPRTLLMSVLAGRLK
ncbi:MAG: 50S ribosomal protein L25 [Cyanobacteria bacterium M5B4]|nr:50S ribosomal protein L25 [Cyanobacteria bacterium KgW148]PLS69405.1 MAG: 50S ribosomal protein L25 [Cyanobacteria bacterium M5B4]